MAAKKAAGMKTGIEIRLLGLDLSREAPHIRHTLALRATLAPQVGQCLFSSAILARFHCQFLQRSIATSQTKTTSAFFSVFCAGRGWSAPLRGHPLRRDGPLSVH